LLSSKSSNDFMEDLTLNEKLVRLFSYEAEPDFIKACYYYGLKEYSWSGNYLNAILDEDIYNELSTIKRLGFNTIMLLVSWSEFEPEVGVANEKAYPKINKISETAARLGLQVMFRIPYLWSLNGEMTTERILYSLLDYSNSRGAFLRFLESFDANVVQKNTNVNSIFGSWEDFYLPVKQAFFGGNTTVGLITKASFTSETSISSDAVVENGENCDLFYNWLDKRIEKLAIQIGNYGYEVRCDGDPCIVKGRFHRHSHGTFYPNLSDGQVLVYWAPFYGAINKGEIISASLAVRRIKLMLNTFAMHTAQRPLVNQFNYYDNSQGTSNHASILSSQYPKFFRKSAKLLANQTCGYGIWTVRDYCHNVLKNPAFAMGSSAWSTKGRVTFRSGQAQLFPGSEISQHIGLSGLSAAGVLDAELMLNVSSGNGEIEIERPGLHTITGMTGVLMRLDLQDCVNGLTVKVINPHSRSNSFPLEINSISLTGHIQEGGPLDINGNATSFYPLIRDFNELLSVRVQKRAVTLPYLHFPKKILALPLKVVKRVLRSLLKM
jgi:hypothetical protein